MVAIQKEEIRLWMHFVITEHSDSSHKGRSYETLIKKTGRMVTRTLRHKRYTKIGRMIPMAPNSKAKTPIICREATLTNDNNKT